MAARTRGVLDSVDVGTLMPFHLNPAEFDKLIVLNGSSGEYRRGQTCPCVRIDTRTPSIGCKVCKGIGVIYPEQLREPMIALDTQRNETLKLAAAGRMPAGTALLVFPSTVVPGEGDMWLPDGEQHIVTDVLFRNGSLRVNDGMLRPNRFSPDQVKPALNPRVEQLTYPAPCCIESVAWFDEAGDIKYSPPSEYHVDENGRWTWRGSAGPPEGKAWTVRYRAPAAYVVYTAVPAFRTESDQAMPYRTMVQPLYRYANEDQQER